MIVQTLISVFKEKGYKLFTDPYKLNIVGVRTADPQPNKFDDHILVFFRDQKDKWHYAEFPATTDPGTYWLQNPMNPGGTAILKEGQYVDAYAMGLHRGQYPALVQKNKPVTILRDYDRNAILDFGSHDESTGFFGINIHRANSSGSTLAVNLYSAGCQVFQRADHFGLFMKLCETHRTLHDNFFTYTLIDLREMERSGNRSWAKKILMGLGVLAGGFLLTAFFTGRKKARAKKAVAVKKGGRK